MNRSLFLTRVLALLVVVALIANRRDAWLLRDPVSLGGLVVLTYLVLSIASCAGLLLRRRWGFYSLYASVLFGTIMLGVSFIPIPLGFLPIRERWIGPAVLNTIVLIAGAFAHHWFRVNAAAQSQSAAPPSA
jgi:hypothetical protein